MKKLTLSFLILLSCFKFSFGQTVRCAADAKVSQNGNLLESINRKVREFQASKSRISSEVLRIPIVVHVIHNNSTGAIGGSNITDEQIFSQIEVLNEDYRKVFGTPGYSDNPLAADMELEFFLANIDPEGFPSTGINRVYSSRRSFGVTERDLLALSELSYWDSNKYLNIWVTNLAGNNLGYAEFPIGSFDGLESVDIDERIDGVFVTHSAFGRETGTALGGLYDRGRTVTHEIGHWLGLIHTWGDMWCGTDYCDDTPQAETSNTDFCNPVFSSCGRVATQNMIENYMDYTPDRCMNIFTNDQKNRVRAILEISKRRQNLLANLDIFKPSNEPIIVRVLGNPVEGESIALQVLVNQAKDFKILISDNSGRQLYTKEFKASLSRSIQVPKSEVGTGILHLRVTSDKFVFNQKIVSL